jgi:hypothetical protein
VRLALHFDEDAMNRGRQSFWTMAKILFTEVLRLQRPRISSQVFIGSLLLHQSAYEVAEVRSNGHTERFNKDRFKVILECWANPPIPLFCTFTKKTLMSATEGRLFVICLASVNGAQARKLDAAFKRSTAYRGAVEVDDSYPAHVLLYPHGLCAFGRIHGSDFSLFWDGTEDDSKDEIALHEMQKFGFRTVKFESLNGRYSIFDKRHNLEGTMLLGETRKLCVGLLADIAERVLNTLTDVAPALPEKLNAALKAFSAANTSDEIAHAALSCRRIIEYVSDCLFPAQDEPSPTGRKLDKQAYKNRLLAYADAARASDTSIDLIVASTATLGEQLERLQAAVNKGLHADLLDVEGRRCVIRTVMLLDDLVSLKSSPFEMKPELQSLKEFLRGGVD